MTTIAYRDGILACDGQTTFSNVSIYNNAVKITKSEDGWLCGGCGDYAVLQHFLNWAEKRKGKFKLPSEELFDHNEYDLIMISPNGVVHTRAISLWQTHQPEYDAWGSGAQIAVGAMAYGASAIEAVECAIRHDIYSSGQVSHVGLSTKRIVKARKKKKKCAIKNGSEIIDFEQIVASRHG